MKSAHRLLLALLLMSLVLPACASKRAWKGQVETWGRMMEVMRDGATEPRVPLASLSTAGYYGVGALEGLEGEVTIVDGTVWVSRAPEADRATTTQDDTVSATLLAAGRVAGWSEHPIDNDMTGDELESFIRRRAARAGVATSRPFPFVVDGECATIDLHVIRGHCPMLGADIGLEPYRGSFQSARAMLVGIFAADAAGVLTHHGASTHTHALVVDESGESIQVTGHVDRVTVRAGSVLRLPQD